MARRTATLWRWAGIAAAVAVLGLVSGIAAGNPIAITVGVATAILLAGLGVRAARGRGIDAANGPGPSVAVGNRTWRWWDTETSMGEDGHGTLPKIMAKINPFYYRTRVGSLEASKTQIARIIAGQRVQPLDWSQANRGTWGAGGVASGFTYDWCTCAQIKMRNPDRPEHETPQQLAEDCLCLCSDCHPTKKGVAPLHWWARHLEHLRVLELREYREEHEHDQPGRFTQWRQDRRADRRDRDTARRMGWVAPHLRPGYDSRDFPPLAPRDADEYDDDPDAWYDDPATDPGSRPDLDHE